MAERKKEPLHISPIGVAVYPNLNTPDKGPPGKDAKPVWKCRVRLDPKEPKVQELMQLLDKLADEGFAKAVAENPKNAKKIRRNDPYIQETDKDGNETGYILIAPKMNTEYKDKKTEKMVPLHPDIRDARKQKIDTNTVKIGGGSKVRVAFKTYPFYVASGPSAGVSLQLQAVQVIELVTFSGGGSGDAFDEVEGYEADESAGGAFNDEGGDTPTTDSKDF